MIIGKHYGIHSVSRLLTVLANMRSCVVRISLGKESRRGLERCSGFFITPELVVAPAFPFFLRFQGRVPWVLVECFRNGKRTWQSEVTAKPEFLAASADAKPKKYAAENQPLLALLRVTRPPTGRSPAMEFLEFGFDAPSENQFVAVAQFPRGDAEHGISFGVLTAAEDEILTYNADTEPGSSGGPVLDSNWRVLGMHFGSKGTRDGNEGVTRSAILGSLRHSRHWPAIKKWHRIVDLAAAKEQIAAKVVPQEPQQAVALLRAAVTASIDRTILTEDEAAIVQPCVVDPKAQRWSLKSNERARLLRAAPSFDELKKVTPYPGTETDAMQAVIDRILEGPPYEIEKRDVEELPLWIQAVRWFADVHPDIPTPAEVTRVLERKRVRSRLDAIAGPDFGGRKSELLRLREWWESSSKPLSLTGIGGIGKSALIARFASELPKDTLILWLDFDRADLAPDDAASVLSAISDQAAIQLDDFVRPNIDGSWKRAANTLGRRLRKALPKKADALLVLDSFEAAQYAARYQELWPVLESIAAEVPQLRLVVTGRAPVPELRLRNRKAEQIHLDGLKAADARTWLRAHGVKDESVRERIVDIARGIPLILRIALHLLKVGGTEKDLVKNLPDHVVMGFLYERILDRVQNPAFKPIATAALALRRITPDMIEPVLGGLDGVELPSEDVHAWFPDLARELALVEGSEVLRLRHEVRAAALELLEKDRADLVKEVDRRAADWYAKQDTNDPEIAAELVYHRLRLGDRRGAEEAWRDGCGRFLTDAADELPPASRTWLNVRLGRTKPHSQATRYGYEVEAAERIRLARSRGLERIIRDILGEQATRTSASPLVFQEAYEAWLQGKEADAIRILERAGDAPGFVGRDRKLLHALLLGQSGRYREADGVLAGIDGEPSWVDRPSPLLYASAVRAARINLSVDLIGESELLDRGGSIERSGLSPIDIVLPRLRARLVCTDVPLEAIIDVLPINVADRSDINRAVEWIREEFESPDDQRKRDELLTAWSNGASWAAAETSATLVDRIREAGWHRWWLATSSDFIVNALALTTQADQTALNAGVVGSLALFASVFPRRAHESVELGLHDSLADTLGRYAASRQILRISSERWIKIKDLLRTGVDEERDWNAEVRHDISPATQEKMVTYIGDLMALPPEQRSVVMHLMSPNPLERVVDELAGYSSATA